MTWLSEPGHREASSRCHGLLVGWRSASRSASWLLFRERATVRELTGIGLVLAGILVLVAVH